ncbi:hypothetical protein [Streptomyces sp. AM 2-1-1]|uniref:hypothetical protein n=1 Tax=Streptomyces sp. AM 2-1-1 TaxID=3028709 RepID=UPI0023B9742D|nr:hypothetical protein [Streptomyces sp. AM 2-1-1]WEH43951.1 hypothetical protein PZB77_30780 [Streptomyces sp. AM 2-1-1]
MDRDEESLRGRTDTDDDRRGPLHAAATPRSSAARSMCSGSTSPAGQRTSSRPVSR